MKRKKFLNVAFFLFFSGLALLSVSVAAETANVEENDFSSETVEPITPYVPVIPLTQEEIEKYKTMYFSDKLSFLYEYYVKNKQKNVTDAQILQEMTRLDDEGGLISVFSDLKGKLKSLEAGYHRTIDEINQAILEKYPGKTEYLINSEDKSTWKNIRYFAFGDKSLDDFLQSFKDERFYSEIYTAPYGQFRLAACANLKNKKKVHMALIALLTPGYRILRQREGEPFIPVKTQVTTSKGISVLPLQYPLTSVFELGNDRAYGYSGKILFPFEVEFETPASAAKFDLTATFKICDADGQCKDETTEPLTYSFFADPFLETPVCPDLREVAMTVPAGGLSGLNFKKAGFKEDKDGNIYLLASFEIPAVNMDTPVLHVANTNGLRFETPFFVGVDGDAVFRSKVLNPQHLKKIGKANLVLTVFNLNRASEFSVSLSLKDVFLSERSVSVFKMFLSFLSGIKFIVLTPLYLLMSLFLYQMLFVRGKNPQATLDFAQGAWYGLALFLSVVCSAAFVIYFFFPNVPFVWGQQLNSPFFNVLLCALFLTAPVWMMKLFDDKCVEKYTGKINPLFKAAGMVSCRQKAGMSLALIVGMMMLFSPMLSTYFDLYALLKPFPVEYGICFLFGIVFPFAAALIYYKPAAELPVRKIRFLKFALFFQAYLHAFLLWLIIGSESGRWIFLGVFVFALTSYFILKNVSKTQATKKKLFAVFLVLMILFVPFLPNSLNFSGFAAYPFNEKDLHKFVQEGKAVYVNVSEDACLACHYNRLAMLYFGGTVAIRQGKLVIMTAPYNTPYLKDFLKDTGLYTLPTNIIFGPAAPQGMLLPSVIHPTTAGIAVSEMFRFYPY